MLKELELSEGTQTFLLFAGLVIAVLLLFVLSIFFWVVVLRLVFWRWWSALLIIGGVVALFLTEVISFPGIFRFFDEGWHNPLIMGLGMLILTAPIGMLMLGFGGSSGSGGSVQVCPSCRNEPSHERCSTCGL